MLKSKNIYERGFSMIELLIVMVIIGVIAAIAIPNLLASRRSANEASALSSIRVIFGAQATYRSTEGNDFYANELSELRSSGIIDPVLGCTADPCFKSGFSFDIDTIPGSLTTHPPLWNVYSVPITPSGAMQTGSVSYYTNEVGSVYLKTGGSAPVAGLSTTVRSPTDGTPVGN